MEKTMTYEIKSSKSSLRNNILLAFFLVLALSGIAINLIFLNVIQTTLTNNGLSGQLVENITGILHSWGPGSQ